LIRARTPAHQGRVAEDCTSAAVRRPLGVGPERDPVEGGVGCAVAASREPVAAGAAAGRGDGGDAAWGCKPSHELDAALTGGTLHLWVIQEGALVQGVDLRLLLIGTSTS
jgi:hypothetical protein